MLFFNEDELQNVVGPHVASNVRYIAFPLSHPHYFDLSSYHFKVLLRLLLRAISKIRMIRVKNSHSQPRKGSSVSFRGLFLDLFRGLFSKFWVPFLVRTKILRNFVASIPRL